MVPGSKRDIVQQLPTTLTSDNQSLIIPSLSLIECLSLKNSHQGVPEITEFTRMGRTDGNNNH